MQKSIKRETVVSDPAAVGKSKKADSKTRSTVSRPRHALAKITPPALSRIYPRERLFQMVDAARKSPVIWVQGPPGAGKTSLIASYLEARKLDSLWYQIDAGDGDLASFFYFLGLAGKQAAPRHRRELPLLTPEYLAGLPTFTRNYFRELFDRLKRPSILVLDNYQDAPDASAIHEALVQAWNEIPPGVNVIIISRSDPLPALSRLRASGSLNLLTWEDLRVTDQEAADIVQLRTGNSGLPQASAQHMQELTQGWMAGIVLLTGAARDNFDASALQAGESHQEIFDYFASEVFARAETALQQFLMKTALLPNITPALAERLTGNDRAQQHLRDLVRGNNFTVRHSSSVETFEFHPLFRAFLANQLTRFFSEPEIVALKRQAAALLADAGEIESAMPLLQQTGDWETFVALLLQHAPRLAQEGRTQTVIAWLDAVPKEIIDRSPWLSYWDGISRMGADPVAARASFEQAYAHCKRDGDALGAYCAWIAIIDSFVFEWSNFAPMLPWVEEFENLRRTYSQFPSVDIEHQAAIAIFIALMHAKPASPELAACAQRVAQIMATVDDPQVCMKAIPHLSMYYTHRMCDLTKANVLIRRFVGMLDKPEVSPLARITCCALTAMCYLNAGEFDDCLANTREGLKLANTHGIHLWDKVLCCGGVVAMTIEGDTAAAESYLALMAAQFNPQRKLDSVFYYIPLAFWHIARAEFSQARAVLEECVVAAENTEFEVSALAALVRISVCSREYNTAAALLQRARVAARLLNNRLCDHTVNAVEAELALACDDEAGCLRALRELLNTGASGGIVTHPFWDAKAMARLYSKALEHDIQPDYVTAVIRKCRLAPPAGVLPEKWPFPLELRAFGGFSIRKDGLALKSEGKAQRRTLELIKAVIAAGGTRVSCTDLASWLWPDADGDAAANSMSVNLHRARKLLGDDDALLLDDRRISLNPQSVWLDLWAFDHCVSEIERITTRADAQADKRIGDLSTRLLALYRGPLLNEEDSSSWVLLARNRSRDAFLRAVTRMCQWHEARAQWLQAIALYERGIQAEPVAEDCYRGLMCCHAAQGNISDAMRAYRRCREMLSIILGVNPSPATEDLMRELYRKS